MATWLMNLAMQNNLILEATHIAPDTKRFIVNAPIIARKHRPGQFVILRISNTGERIPLSIVDSDPIHGTITLIVKEIGKTTRCINQLSAGESILDLVGPLGRPTKIKNFGQAVLIGGGVGIAVGYSQAKALKLIGNHLTIIIGARNKSLLILEEEMGKIADRLLICTDDGSYGTKGFVTHHLKALIDEQQPIDYVQASGPIPMMHAVADLTRPHHIHTVVSLNPIMVDATGMCGGCRVTIGDEVKFACVDGPDFDAHLVDFDALCTRNLTYVHEEKCALKAAEQELRKENQTETTKIFHTQIHERDPLERIKDFDEVNLGFSEEMALLEAERCLQCPRPTCVEGCPIGVQIPQFIQLLTDKEYVQSSRLIKQDNVLAAVCSRVCPQSDQCEGSCILTRLGEPPVKIGELARFVTDFERQAGSKTVESPRKNTAPKKKVAIVGSGPAGLACAGDLAKMGYNVTVFEAFHQYGGVLVYGIPAFRLPKGIVAEEIQRLAELGVEFRSNCVIGMTYSINELMTEMNYEAVFIAVGAGLPYFMNIPGENLIGVYSANEFLTRVNLMKAYQFPKYDTPILNCQDKHVAVIGGGNTALDSARVALRLGAKKSSIIYRRTQSEMPARLEEITHAQEEGIDFNFLTNPVAFIGDESGHIKSIRNIRMRLGDLDSSGRPRPVPIEGSEYKVPIDVVVVAIGNGANKVLPRTMPDLSFNKWGNILIDQDTMATNKPGVFAGGDIVTGSATVILAMGAGRKAAQGIHQYLESV